ncbi:thioredoxin family protein [Sinorhizobium medicae]|uniref:thioredoxin family protein n=1 Tax=Sinorhizobium medicae TaxID=110321 RepID=UPI000FD7E143|nr:thioredoxin domain-containing protein [Sinorhizobium medicae]RVJ69527.1 thiol reductase thioredoxin [Sinorhizobium medicae]
MPLMRVGTSNFQKEVLKSAEPVIAIFSTEGCGPCERIETDLERMATELAGKAKVVKIDIVETPELAEQYGVCALPTLAIFKDGDLIDIMVGAQPGLRSWILLFKQRRTQGDHDSKGAPHS